MQLCGLGGPELIIVALLSYVVFGPERAKSAALSAGKFLRKVTRSPWFKDISLMTRQIRDLPNTLIRLAELEEVQAELKKDMKDISAELDDVNLNVDRGLATDPWGIENAVAGTTKLGEQEPAVSKPDAGSPDARENEGSSDNDTSDDESPA